MPDWSAALIVPGSELDGAPLLRRELTLDTGHGEVTAAVLHATAHGVYEAFLNGRPVSDEVLSPGWSAYEWRLRYRSHDVTDLLEPTSVLGFALGHGWWAGRLGWNGGRGYYGSELGVLAQLEITFADGHVQRVVTDEDWTAGPSAVLADDLYDGQTVDARRYSDAWLRPGFAGEGWTGVRTSERDLATLTPYVGPPVRRQAEIAPVRTWTSPAGATLVDFGQNLVGWVRVRVSGPAGTEVTLRHAEVLEHDELGVRPLRSALATDHFVLSGGEDVFEPTFTFHGFRYAEVQGWPGELADGDLTAVVVSSDLERTGEFSCSHPLLGRLHENAVWGTVGNFLDVPTDCPQRDERLGWTGDIAAFTPSAAFLFDVEPFLRDWLRDLAAEQQAADGMVAFVIPDVLKYVTKDDPEASAFPDPDSTAVWSDAAVWVPWALWQAYGDLSVLADQYDSMTAHVRRVETLTSPTGLWDTGFQFGDWLDPTAPPENPILAKADNGVVATACLYRSATLVAETAGLLGRSEDQAHFAEVAARTRAAFLEHYVGADGRITSDAVTVYALAIVFGCRRGRAAPAGGGAAGRPRRRGRLPHPDRLRGHAVRHRRADHDGTPGRRLPAAAAGGVPVLAVPRDDGRDDDLGALGLDAAGRHHQPRADDELQPLRPGRRRRLDAPHPRRPRTAGARLREGARRPAARGRHHLGEDRPADPARPRRGLLVHRGGRGPRRRRRAAGGRQRPGPAARRHRARGGRRHLPGGGGDRRRLTSGRRGRG